VKRSAKDAGVVKKASTRATTSDFLSRRSGIRKSVSSLLRRRIFQMFFYTLVWSIYMNQNSVLLLGATGLVGGECLKLLCQDDFWNRVVVFIRRSLPEMLLHPKIESHVIDFDKPESYRDFLAVNQVISALGTTIKKAGSRENFYRVDFTYPYQIAQAARKQGADHLLLVSSSGANAKSRIFYSRVKGELDEAVAQLGYGRVSTFRPSLLLGERNESRLGEDIAKVLSKYTSFLIPLKYRPIEARAVAGAMVKVAKGGGEGLRIYESDDIQKIYRNG